MVWDCMLWDGGGYVCKIDGWMDGDLFIQILDDELQESLPHKMSVGWMGTFSSRIWMMNFENPLLITANLHRTSSFSWIMTLNIPAKRPRNGLKTLDSFFYWNL